MTKKFCLLTLLSFCIVQRTWSQALTTSALQLDFGNVYENVPQSLPLTITNTLARDVNVYGILFYNIYGQPAFSASEEHFTVTASSSYNISITFSPRHNIAHNSEMVIVNDGLRGYTSVDLIGQGTFSNTYYDATENLTEENLKSAIKTLTGIGYLSLGYNVARDNMFMIIDNQKINGQGATQNTIECIYTGRDAIGYTSRTDCQTNYSFNTEHTFPQSFFNSVEPMRSDLHHLFPCDDAANNERGDNPFAEVSSPTWTNGGSRSDGDYFEPRDQHKGAAARAMVYFVLRYQNPNYNAYYSPQESVLRNWHETFPPTPFEKKRNDDIFSMQHNRNPFVDYPQFTERIHSISSTSVDPVVRSLDIPEDTIIYGFVTQATPVDFHFVLVNKGNAGITLSNFALSQPAFFSFLSGGVNTTLAPGEALSTDIRLVTTNTDSIRAFLSFDSNDPAHGHVTIPVFANDSMYNGVEEMDAKDLEVYPNPVADKLNIQFPSLVRGSIQVEILNLQGEKILSMEGVPGRLQIDSYRLSSGLYFLKAISGEKIFYGKFVKE